MTATVAQSMPHASQSEPPPKEYDHVVMERVNAAMTNKAEDWHHENDRKAFELQIKYQHLGQL